MNTFEEQPNVQQKALQKALKSPRIGKHGKRKATLLKEEVYKQMQDKILDKVEALINTQIKLALTGNNGKPDSRAIDSLLNRVFGKPAQEIKIESPVEVPFDPVEKAKSDKLIRRLLESEKICAKCKQENKQ